MSSDRLNLRVLWADDQPEVIHSLEQYIAPLANHIRFTQDGAETLRLLQEEAFDLLLLDLQMPPGRWGGIEVLQSIGPPPLMLPVVVLSGAGTIRECTQAVRLGARDYVEKEMASNDLERVVMASVKGWREERPLTDYDVVRRLEQQIHARVLDILRTKASGNGDRDIFVSVVPREIAVKTYERMLDHKGSAQQEVFLDLIDLRRIMDQLWNTTDDLQQLGVLLRPKTREDRTSWLVRLNEIRKIVAHPMRGELDEVQRAELRDIANRVAPWLLRATG